MGAASVRSKGACLLPGRRGAKSEGAEPYDVELLLVVVCVAVLAVSAEGLHLSLSLAVRARAS